MTEEPSAAEPRITPYDLVFGPAVFEERFFPGIAAEAARAGVSESDASQFLMLGNVGRLLRELVPEDAPAEATREIGLLLFHAFHFWRGGRRVLLLDEPLARVLAGSAGHSLAHATAPFPAGYLQLPRHLFWSTVEEGARPEACDGLFWVATATAGTAPRLDVLLALGVRPERAGLSVVHLDFELHDASRVSVDAFRNVLPGGELGGLLSLTTPAEVLELTLRCFSLAANAEAVSATGGNTFHRLRERNG